ncbi:MAG: energy transducer TonB [Thiobacillaceae bacterium]
MSLRATDSLARVIFRWRRGLIALWVSAALHLVLLGFIRFHSAPVQRHSDPIVVQLEQLAPVETAVPILRSEVSALPQEVIPLPETQVSSGQPAPELAQEPVQSPLPHVDLPALVDPNYYDAFELDIPNLEPVGKIEPVDPELGSAHPHTGYIRLQLKLEADGRVNEATVVETNLPPDYEKVALDAFRNARFYPAKKNGRSVRAKFTVELSFRPPQPILR